MDATTPIIPKVTRTSARVNAFLPKFFNLATCVAPSARVNALFLVTLVILGFAGGGLLLKLLDQTFQTSLFLLEA